MTDAAFRDEGHRRQTAVENLNVLLKDSLLLPRKDVVIAYPPKEDLVLTLPGDVTRHLKVLGVDAESHEMDDAVGYGAEQWFVSGQENLEKLADAGVRFPGSRGFQTQRSQSAWTERG